MRTIGANILEELQGVCIVDHCQNLGNPDTLVCPLHIEMEEDWERPVTEEEIRADQEGLRCSKITSNGNGRCTRIARVGYKFCPDCQAVALRSYHRQRQKKLEKNQVS